jgi:hypothetical protein
MSPRPVPITDRLDRLSMPEPNGGCVLWLGALNSDGYGLFQVGRGIGTKLAHRVAYAERVGPIPDGLTIDHLCRTKACINEWHMEVVTLAVNCLRRSRHLALRRLLSAPAEVAS